MLSTFLDKENTETYNYVIIIQQAIKLSGYTVLRDTFLASVFSNPDIPDDQKNGTQIVAKSSYSSEDLSQIDNLLLDIMFKGWEDYNVVGVTALTGDGRIGMLNGIRDIAKFIINNEITRLEGIRDLPTSIPETWNTPDEPPG